jgi:hypothetical protein
MEESVQDLSENCAEYSPTEGKPQGSFKLPSFSLLEQPLDCVELAGLLKYGLLTRKHYSAFILVALRS